MPRRPSDAPDEVQDDDRSSSAPSDEETREVGMTVQPRTSREVVELDRRKSEHTLIAEVRRHSRTPSFETSAAQESLDQIASQTDLKTSDAKMEELANTRRRRVRLRSPWSSSLLTLLVTTLAAVTLFSCLFSFVSRQMDVPGCRMSYMRPAFARLNEFDTEHTRFASKYSLYLYREGGVDEDTRVKGVPVLFIPGNAGSYKQVRPIAAEAANYFHDVVQHDSAAMDAGASSVDFFTADFNEDITAFHGQTLLDQAEYLNEAISYILSLYHDPSRSMRASGLPDPSSVILVGHSMGGIVARTMLTMPNYQSNSINTIITMSAPHARPPVAFDGDIVRAYQRINDYWRKAYAQKWANNNPLWHVTLISVVGGGLDTMIPSDYASISSLVPDTHGFTVFTSSVPHVWTGMDHQAILWCDQFRKVLIRALMEVLNSKRPGQTKPRADRMRVFKQWFLTGMESTTEKKLPQQKPTTLLTLEDGHNSVMPQGERFVMRTLGNTNRAKAYLLPIPPHATPGRKRFTLLTDQQLNSPEGSKNLQVLLCSVFPLEMGQSATLFTLNMDLSGDGSGSTRLACKNAEADVISLPASTKTSRYPFEEVAPFSYLEYDVDVISEHQLVAVVDKAITPTNGWVMAEFSDRAASEVRANVGMLRLLTMGVTLQLPAQRGLTTRIKIPTIQSALLAYRIHVGKQRCNDGDPLFAPLLRQYLNNPYESKFFVNVGVADLNLHGIAPFMPSPLRQQSSEGLSLEIWSDPTCGMPIDITLEADVFGSLGKLVVRYRTVFAAFPLLVVALVLCKQFSIYDTAGTFISFAEALDLCLRQSIPLVFIALSIFAFSLARSSSSQDHRSSSSSGWSHWGRNSTESAVDYTKNDLLLGSPDPFFWFLVPLFGLVSVGICVVMNYTLMTLTHILSMIYDLVTFRPAWISNEDRRRPAPPMTFAASSPGRRILTASVLLFLVSTIIPYQFAFLVACVVQMTTCTRALKLVRETRSNTTFNFYNYAHSLLVLMIWFIG
ncbi:MAG: mitochondrial membrane protein [Watsoniomyces obsoletus]|nr:MAG: mitochondrial membrane protein [Watsoniomyces obsoletus]